MLQSIIQVNSPLETGLPEHLHLQMEPVNLSFPNIHVVPHAKQPELLISHLKKQKN